MNLRDQYSAALEKLGETKVLNHKSLKYRIYTRSRGGFYYLGSAGAFRYGPTVKGSHPLSDASKAAILHSQRA